MANDNPIQIDVEFQTTEPVSVDVGEMYKGGDGSFAGLADVSLDNPTNGQVPKYNAETAKWENADDNTATQLSDLTDVTLDEPSEGQVLKFDGETWKNENDDTVSNFADLEDVALTTPTNGQIPKYNDQTGKWENADETDTDELTELTDTTITSPTQGQVLKYDGSKWVNADEVEPTEVVANPVGEATTDLTKLQVGEGIYSIPQGGTDVAVTQIQTTGTKIATITVDDVPTDLYAPQGGGGASSADQVSVDDTNLDYEADDVQEALEKVTKSITWADYNALTTEEKNNGTIYLITDVNGDGQSFQPVIFSLEERCIGVWFDGKPLYQKTFYKTGTTSLGTSYQFDCSDLNIDSVSFVSDGSFAIQDNGSVRAMDYTHKNGAAYGCQFSYSPSVITITLNNSGGWVFYTVCATINYTKTTDAPGSGTWTPQGVPAIHYSTDEHVVGTWIDGSTIYERTVELLSELTIPTNAWTEVSSPFTSPILPVNFLAYIKTGTTSSDRSDTVWTFIAPQWYNNKLSLLNPRNANVKIDKYTIQYVKLLSS